MTGAWHGGKGSDTRPEAEAGNFGRGYDVVDWNKRIRERVAALPDGNWIAMCDRLPERGMFVDLYDGMFDRVDTHLVDWDPAKTDGDYIAWRPAS